MEEVHWVREYDSKTFKLIIKCNERGCTYTTTSLIHIKIHVFRIHGKFDSNDLSKWEADEDNLWQYFKKKELFLAKCKTCDSELIVYTKTNLSVHLQSDWHTTVKEFISTSLPQHFEAYWNNKKFRCIHCNTWYSNVQRIDDLKNHLMSHKNECSGSSGGSENKNVNATMQQLECERNVASTSSHYINPQPAPENEEVQERSTNINEQEAPEYESPLDDDMFWIRNFQL